VKPREALVALIAFLGLMHLQITLPLLVLVASPRSASGLGTGGAGSSDQGGIGDRALLHCHTTLLEMAFHCLVDEVLRRSRSALRVHVLQAGGVRS